MYLHMNGMITKKGNKLFFLIANRKNCSSLAAVLLSVIYKPADIRVLMDDIDIEGLCIIPHPLFLVCAVRFFFLLAFPSCLFTDGDEN